MPSVPYAAPLCSSISRPMEDVYFLTNSVHLGRNTPALTTEAFLQACTIMVLTRWPALQVVCGKGGILYTYWECLIDVDTFTKSSVGIEICPLLSTSQKDAADTRHTLIILHEILSHFSRGPRTGVTRFPCFLVPVLPYKCRLFLGSMKRMKKAVSWLRAKEHKQERVLTTVSEQ